MNGFELARRLLRPLVFSYVRPRLVGLERIPAAGPAILAGNHPNLLDGVVLALASPRPVRFLVAGELFDSPFLRPLLRWAGCVPVDRRGGSNREALAAAEAALARGEVVGLFPEGRTNNGGPLLELRPGAALLALRTGSPVVPFGVAGTERLWPWGARTVEPGPVTLAFGQPLAVEREARDPLPAGRVREVLDRLAASLERNHGRARRLLARVEHRPPNGLAALVLRSLAWAVNRVVWAPLPAGVPERRAG